MTLARRIAAYFVAPADERAHHRAGEPGPQRRSDAADVSFARGRTSAAADAEVRLAPTRTSTGDRPPPAVAVLAPPADAQALGAALGLALARARRTPVAVLCVWAPQPAGAGWRAPPRPAAARVASALTARGHEARAAGRLAVVRLSSSCEEAAAQALRVSAAAGPAPTVLALAGPRSAAFDALLAMQDLVVVAVAPASDAALARLATAGLERSLTCAVAPATPGRALAAAGLALLPSMRRALAAPLAALS